MNKLFVELTEKQASLLRWMADTGNFLVVDAAKMSDARTTVARDLRPLIDGELLVSERSKDATSFLNLYLTKTSLEIFRHRCESHDEHGNPKKELLN